MKLFEDTVGGLLGCDGVPEAVAGDDDEVLGAVHLDRSHVGVGAYIGLVIAVTCKTKTKFSALLKMSKNYCFFFQFFKWSKFF